MHGPPLAFLSGNCSFRAALFGMPLACAPGRPPGTLLACTQLACLLRALLLARDLRPPPGATPRRGWHGACVAGGWHGACVRPGRLRSGAGTGLASAGADTAPGLARGLRPPGPTRRHGWHGACVRRCRHGAMAGTGLASAGADTAPGLARGLRPPGPTQCRQSVLCIQSEPVDNPVENLWTYLIFEVSFRVIHRSSTGYPPTYPQPGMNIVPYSNTHRLYMPLRLRESVVVLSLCPVDLSTETG
jgi:hypothetical protein